MKTRKRAKESESRRKNGRGRARNGEGGVYRRGGVWYARWTDADGIVHARSTGESDEGAARRRLAEFVAPFRAGRRAEVLRAIAERVREAEDERPPVRVDGIVAAVAATGIAGRWSRAVRCCSLGRIKRWAAWMQRERPRRELVRETTARDAAAFLDALAAAGVGGKTRNDYRALLAQAWGLVGAGGDNPWRAAPLARTQRVDRRPLSREELGRLLEAAPTVGADWRRLLLVGVYTGLRLGDARALDWRRVDLAGGWIDTIAHKTGARVRIPLAAPLAEELARTPPAERIGPVCPEAAELSTKSAERRLARVWRAAGVDPWEVNPQGRRASVAGFHALRHTFVSLAADAGVPLAVVQAIVGHSAEAMTRRYYHAGDAALRAAAAALPDVSAPKSARSSTSNPATVAGLDGMSDAELRALARAVRERLRDRKG